MDECRKERLVKLGPDALADALLKLADHDESAGDLVERMTATPTENNKRFKAKLAGLKRSRRFVGWNGAAELSRQLETLLDDLKAGVSDPGTGAELVASFFKSDESVFNRCDDSSGLIGDVYRLFAKDLFIEYASRCDDKEWLAELVFELSLKDDYGVRDVLIGHASDFLPEPVIRDVISRFQKIIGVEIDEYRKKHLMLLVESLARQVKDAPLFEKTRIANWGDPGVASCIDIARVYLESGDIATALAWLDKLRGEAHFRENEQDELLLDIYGRLGDRVKQSEVAWRIFRRCRRVDSLEELLAVIGGDGRSAVIDGEVSLILGEKTLSVTDAAFLIDAGRMDDAERYLIDRVDRLDGDMYGSFLPLAESMESNGRILAATMIYRALLDSILRRAQTKTYFYGVRYLKKIEKLAISISDWRGMENHDAYSERIRLKHGRKSSFWSKYEKK